MRNFILAASVGSLLFPCFRAADAGGVTGSPPSPPLTGEQQLAAARAELQTAQTNLLTITGERDSARQENGNLRSQFDSATTAATKANGERDQARNDLATANANLLSVTTERDTARSELTTEKQSVSRLETLCGIRGIDPKKAVPAAPESTAKKSVADYNIALSQAKTPEQRNTILKEFAEAAKNKQIAPEV